MPEGTEEPSYLRPPLPLKTKWKQKPEPKAELRDQEIFLSTLNQLPPPASAQRRQWVADSQVSGPESLTFPVASVI